MDDTQVEELLCQALETEIGGVMVYEHAVRCALNADLKKEWREYLDQTRNHERILRDVFGVLKLDAEKETPGRKVVRHQGKSLVQAMLTALKDGTPEAAQLVAAECVVLAETKDHQNWELLAEVAKGLKGEAGRALTDACEKVEDEEDEHLYHTAGWARELWLESLGLPAVLPPPEERKDVKTQAEAARAKDERKELASRGR
jgi:rubrerythrin